MSMTEMKKECYKPIIITTSVYSLFSDELGLRLCKYVSVTLK